MSLSNKAEPTGKSRRLPMKQVLIHAGQEGRIESHARNKIRESAQRPQELRKREAIAPWKPRLPIG